MTTGRNTGKRLSSIPAPESAPRSKERLKDLRSEITDLKRILPSGSAPPIPAIADFTFDDAIPRTMPSGGWHRLASALVEMSVHHVVLSQWTEARSTAMDALLLLDMLEENRAWADLSFTLGEVLLTLSEAHRARERFDEAAAWFDEQGDLEAAAKAKVGLARAMTMLRDPVGRAVLEDAGTLFEELGNEEAVKLIDVELRELTAVLEESPTSFQAITPRRK
jgi:hypothetical protein